MAKVYRVAVVGRTGRGDYGHAVDLAWAAVPRTKVVAVCDDDKVGLAAAAKRLSVEQAFTDYRAMLDQVKPDIVAVCQRWVDRHAEMVVAAAERGIHVYMEKPLCRTLAEADAIVTAAGKTHARVAIAHPTRYSPKMATIKEIIASGKLGRILEFRGRGKEDQRGGGEDLWVLGSHVMDMIRALGGDPQWCFAQVTQKGKPITKADVVDGNEGLGPLAGDAVVATYGMPSGANAYFQSVRGAAGKPSRYGLQIFGTAGVIELLEGIITSVKYLPDPSWSPGRSGAKWQDVSSAGIGKPEPLQSAQYQARHTLAIEDLLDSIEQDRQPKCSVYEARGAVEMIAAVFESQRVGTPVTLPLKTRENPLTLLK